MRPGGFSQPVSHPEGEAAAELLRGAADLEQQGRFAEAHHQRGLAFEVLGRVSDALCSFDSALALRPASAGSLFHKARLLHRERRFEEALACYDAVLVLRPGHAVSHAGRGATLFRLNCFEEALASFERALALEPGDTEVLTSCGVALQALGRFPEALARYEAALAIEPNRPETHWYEGMTRMSMGDWLEGWRKLDWRWRKSEFAGQLDLLPRPAWRGEQPVEGRTLLLFSEQGLGDTLQFVRYAPWVAARGARVALSVQPELKALLSGMDGVERVATASEPIAFDLHCPLMSLPLAFGTTPATVPAEVPYLRAAPERLEIWRQRLGAASGPRIGLVWSGSAAHRDDHNRSVPLEQLLPLIGLAGPEMLSLQKEVRPADRAVLAASGMRHLGDALADFADTAALVSLLDLVISVDTALVHLAGGLARPVWVMLSARPDWRWMREREDSPWYPTARLFRQQAGGSWDEVIRRVRGELLRLLAEPGGFRP